MERGWWRPAVRRGIGIAAVAGVAIGVAAGPAAADPREDAANALGHGDGAGAAKIIAASGYQTKAWILGDIIYDAGVIAVDTHNGDAYSDALPVAYLRSGVTFATADNSFEYAATNVVQRGVTVEQARVGGLAVLKTNLAYGGINGPAAAAPAASTPAATSSAASKPAKTKAKSKRTKSKRRAARKAKR